MTEANNEQRDTLPLEEVRRLVDLLKEAEVGEIQVRKGEFEVTVKAMPTVSEVQSASVPQAREVAVEEHIVEDDGLHAVLSPLVGTFFRSPGPGEESYVEVGDKVVAGQTLCIVEAMKLMNEIPADTDGEIAEILVENSGGVQYGQPLFHLRPES
jgi:acetyl-CoA carboxylase biotin carboxyl carrier protein